MTWCNEQLQIQPRSIILYKLSKPNRISSCISDASASRGIVLLSRIRAGLLGLRTHQAGALDVNTQTAMLTYRRLYPTFLHITRRGSASRPS